MKEYQTIEEISGPLVFVEIDEPVGYDEIVDLDEHQRPADLLDRLIFFHG